MGQSVTEDHRYGSHNQHGSGGGSAGYTFLGLILGAVLAGYAGVYLVTANDLTWQLQTSLRRLLVQVWPVLVLAGFVGLRAPEAAAIVKVAK